MLLLDISGSFFNCDGLTTLPMYPLTFTSFPSKVIVFGNMFFCVMFVQDFILSGSDSPNSQMNSRSERKSLSAGVISVPLILTVKLWLGPIMLNRRAIRFLR